jgi:hypothetical protein
MKKRSGFGDRCGRSKVATPNLMGATEDRRRAQVLQQGPPTAGGGVNDLHHLAARARGRAHRAPLAPVD